MLDESSGQRILTTSNTTEAGIKIKYIYSFPTFPVVGIQLENQSLKTNDLDHIPVFRLNAAVKHLSHTDYPACACSPDFRCADAA